MQEYIVEVYNLSFEKIADVGPFSYDKARETWTAYNKRGLIAAITEKELLGNGVYEND